LVGGIRTGPALKTRPTFAVYHRGRLAPAIVLLQKQASTGAAWRSAVSQSIPSC